MSTDGQFRQAVMSVQRNMASSEIGAATDTAASLAQASATDEGRLPTYGRRERNGFARDESAVILQLRPIFRAKYHVDAHHESFRRTQDPARSISRLLERCHRCQSEPGSRVFRPSSVHGRSRDGLNAARAEDPAFRPDRRARNADVRSTACVCRSLTGTWVSDSILPNRGFMKTQLVHRPHALTLAITDCSHGESSTRASAPDYSSTELHGRHRPRWLVIPVTRTRCRPSPARVYANAHYDVRA